MMSDGDSFITWLCSISVFILNIPISPNPLFLFIEVWLFEIISSFLAFIFFL
jgi:hypothetical protein